MEHRQRRAALLTRLERATDWPLTVLAVTLIPILLAPVLLDLSDATEDLLGGLDYLIWGIFAADLVVKVAIVPDRRGYLRAHWLDVVLVALPMLRPLRLVRSARLLRSVRGVRTLAVLLRALSGGQRLLRRHRLDYALVTALGAIVVCGGLVTLIERGHDDATITDLGDGLWWAMTTVTTVGYGDTYPRTAEGRGVGVVLMLVGIALFGVITANLAAFFVEAKEDALAEEIAALRAEIERLSHLIEQGAGTEE